MKNRASQFFQFEKREAKEFFRKARSRKKIKGLEILLAPNFLDYGRLLVITPRRAGNAPQRNLIRRRLKHIFFEDKLYEQPFDCVVIVSKDAINLTFQELKEILHEIINNAKKNSQ
ncbi:ribonuclease P protein component [candidate division TM6 bacterium RIFCSPHIGHO2_12_FULL_32_22]|nr:MAG: ribonuclease P protein component [candidate division TM6 bacterium RIFCSPHIGHO2_12_FULL_32_22]